MIRIRIKKIMARFVGITLLLFLFPVLAAFINTYAAGRIFYMWGMDAWWSGFMTGIIFEASIATIFYLIMFCIDNWY
jgi:hypothetical protein